MIPSSSLFSLFTYRHHLQRNCSGNRGLNTDTTDKTYGIVVETRAYQITDKKKIKQNSCKKKGARAGLI